jgi:hypothetical protein
MLHFGLIQDAFHYALAACGGCALGYESVFTVPMWRRSRAMVSFTEPACAPKSRTEYLRLAYRAALEAGMTGIARPRTLADAERLAKQIKDRAYTLGVDAYTGERREA